MANLETPNNNGSSSASAKKILSRSPSPNRLPPTTRPWNAATFCVEENTMSRCKSPVAVRHERGSSADTGLIRMDHSTFSEDLNVTGDEADGFRSFSGTLPNGSSNEFIEEGGDNMNKTKQMEQILTKINATKNLILREQSAQDANVNEYLKLTSSNSDKNQVQRIKCMFEKRNQKSAQSIAMLQKKLKGYSHRLETLEANAASGHRPTREMLRDMGQGLKYVGSNIRGGITGLSGSVMSKPREFAHLIRNKFGSADNISTMSRSGEHDSIDEESRIHHGSATLPGGCSLSSSGGGVKYGTSAENSESSSVTSESNNSGAPQSRHHSHTKSSSNHSYTTPSENKGASSSGVAPAVAGSTTDTSLEPVFSELCAHREEISRLKSKLDHVKKIFSKDIEHLNQALQEECVRSERMEEQINDLTELHQNEVQNLKQTICDMEEKVQYQSEERLRDIHEVLESCQTKISKMEHQQAQHQQYLTIEGLDNSNARALVVKLINIVMTILQVVLLLVGTTAGILMPFLRTRFRIITTAVVVFSVIIAMKSWPDGSPIPGNFILKYFKRLIPFM